MKFRILPGSFVTLKVMVPFEVELDDDADVDDFDRLIIDEIVDNDGVVDAAAILAEVVK